MERRVAAFAIDFGAAALPSLLLGSSLYIPTFIILWAVLRVVWVVQNRGQSFGRWAMDMKVVNPRFRVIPSLVDLSKREAITGFGGLLILIGIATLSPTNGFLLVAPIPLLVDCSFAFTDRNNRQAFHDRVAYTIIVQSSRGYSLDIKIKQIFAEAKRRVK
jgi:uncharacterized RDD family membrane protein YckC